MTETKLCTWCGEVKLITEYYKRAASKDGLQSHCIPCDKVYSQRYRHRNRGKCHKLNRKSNLKQKYGLTVEQVNLMYAEQDGKCVICQRGMTYDDGIRGHPNKMNIDHCHITGKVRGLLCGPCNKGLGHFEDNVVSMQRAIEYLKSRS